MIEPQLVEVVQAWVRSSQIPDQHVVAFRPAHHLGAARRIPARLPGADERERRRHLLHASMMLCTGRSSS